MILDVLLNLFCLLLSILNEIIKWIKTMKAKKKEEK